MSLFKSRREKRREEQDTTRRLLITRIDAILSEWERHDPSKDATESGVKFFTEARDVLQGVRDLLGQLYFKADPRVDEYIAQISKQLSTVEQWHRTSAAMEVVAAASREAEKAASRWAEL